MAYNSSKSPPITSFERGLSDRSTDHPVYAIVILDCYKDQGIGDDNYKIYSFDFFRLMLEVHHIDIDSKVRMENSVLYRNHPASR